MGAVGFNLLRADFLVSNLFLLKFAWTALNPAAAIVEDRRQAKRVAGILRVSGLVVLLAGLGAFAFSLQGSVLAPKPPTMPIYASDISKDSLTGPLNEALVDGYLHLDQMAFILFPRKIAFLNRETTVIPLTGADWVAGDPVKVFLSSNWLSRTSGTADLAQLLGAMGLVVGGIGLLARRSLRRLED